MNLQNLNTLIIALRAAPDTEFNIQHMFTSPQGGGSNNRHVTRGCGTAACILGFCVWLRIAEGTPAIGDTPYWGYEGRAWLGLTPQKANELFMPAHWAYYPHLYPRRRAIAVLEHMRDHYMATGLVTVDWGRFPVSNYLTPPKPWATPVARELTPPALPSSLTALLEHTPAATPAVN